MAEKEMHFLDKRRLVPGRQVKDIFSPKGAQINAYKSILFCYHKTMTPEGLGI
jgi:hypothetical protein